jgi:diguanylate cyclase (GGDEF)-like protein
LINAPFGHCKTAALELADSIHDEGVMLVLDTASARIVAASANAGELLGKPAQALLGQSADAVFGPASGLELLEPGSWGDEVVDLQRARFGNGEHVVAQHLAGPHLIVEIEAQATVAPRLRDRLLAHGLARLGAAETPQATGETLMRLIAELCGFDRVLLIRFLPDWHCKVLAEIAAPGMDSYLGLHFPESDLPANARRLYLRKKQRLISDIERARVPVLGEQEGLVVDLARAELRAVHPVHLKDLRNMGVSASFSVSVLAGDRLWGLISCHHRSAKRVSFAMRQLADHLASVAAIRLGDLEGLELERERHALDEAQGQIRAELQSGGLEPRTVAAQLRRACEAYRAQGAWARIDGRDQLSGEVPDERSRAMLERWLGALDIDSVSAFSRIPEALADNPDLVRRASGMLYLPLSSRSFVLLFRAEQIELVQWAGKPGGETGGAPGDTSGGTPDAAGSESLTPRRSFAVWREQTRGAAPPWREADIEGGIRLREMLLDYVDQLRLAHQANTDPLTQLANRLMFERRLADAIDQSRDGGGSVALMMIDLDRFKPVNDTFGHAAGDAVLVEVASRLRGQLRETDLVARLGGDEFAVLSHWGPDEIAQVAERLLQAVGKPFEVEGQEVSIGASIGAAICPLHASDPAGLLERADRALYRAKHAGRGRFRLFRA